jgi:hypothetical protein
MPERLLDHHAAPLVPFGLSQAVLGQLPADLLERLRRDREVERVVPPGAADVVEFLDGLAKTLKGAVVVELTLHKTDALGQLVPHRLVKRRTCVGLHGSLHLSGEILLVPRAPGKAHQREAGRQQPAVGEVIHGRHELLAGKVTGHPEEHQRGRTGNPVQAAVTRIPQRIAQRFAGTRPGRPAVFSFWHGCFSALALGNGG